MTEQTDTTVQHFLEDIVWNNLIGMLYVSCGCGWSVHADSYEELGRAMDEHMLMGDFTV